MGWATRGPWTHWDFGTRCSIGTAGVLGPAGFEPAATSMSAWNMSDHTVDPKSWERTFHGNRTERPQTGVCSQRLALLIACLNRIMARCEWRELSRAVDAREPRAVGAVWGEAASALGRRKGLFFPRDVSMNFYVMLITAVAWLVAPAVLSAQETAKNVAGAANGGGNPPPAGGGGSGEWLFLFLLPMALVVFMMLVMRPQQKDQKQREKMLSELKKNDRVVTTAGILGKVSIVSPENKTVKLVVDEKSGSCMTVTMSSIARVLTGEEKGDLAEDTK